ncbi:MAG: ATP-grasp domain-containing protein [Planctomycetota bacterium]|jgi:carbamoyl-phosphate synthase large subunit
MTKLKIGVTGINAVDNPGPGVGVARSLQEAPDLDVEIIGLAYDAMDPGIYMDWVVDKSYLLPYPSNSGEDYIERLLDIKREYGLDFVIPNLDAELPIYIKYSERLEAYGIKTFLPTMQQFRLRGKDQLAEIADKVEINLPQTEIVSSHAELAEAIQRIGLPVMVKGIFYKAHLCSTVQEAQAHFDEIAAEWGYPIIVQKVVGGTPLNVVGVGDGEGGNLGLCCVKKVNLTSLGKIWTGVSVNNRAMLAAADKFIKEFRWRGPFELECLVENNEVSLIEINPRFPAWVYFASGIGMNLPAQMIRLSTGNYPELLNTAEAGKLFIRYTYDIVADMDKLQTIVTTGESK